ncbi:MAG: MATE family efflux transporter [Phycisphaerae bacterium]|nr:MATE family efflux transporter [Phycisphaerae bacterium]
MAVPMLAGTFAMNAYHLTDTWFVSRLGTLPLAAMGFTFPVIMLLTFLAGGIATGVTTLVSHALGRHDHPTAARLVTHGIILMLTVSGIILAAGYGSITFLFRQLGADDATLPLIQQYMRIWFLGAPFMALPMLGNGILISAGDSRLASRLILLGTLLNVIFDPILIFGLLGFPAMGIAGAALASLIARTVVTAWLLWLLWKKHRLLALRGFRWRTFGASTRRIAGFAIPSMLSMILMPISAAVITRILSRFGNEAVAAAGAAGRIEMFAFVIPMALGISLTPFVSQNFGAERVDRIREALRASCSFAVGYGGVIAVIFFLAARPLASIFTDNPNVLGILVSYIRIISFGYGMMEVHRYCGFFLTGMHKPSSATILNVIRVLVLLIPLSLLGARWFDVRGVFWGRLITDVVVGTLGLLWVSRVTRNVSPAEQRQEA